MALAEYLDAEQDAGAKARDVANSAVASARVRLDDRFEIDTQRPIPQLDSPGATAFTAVDLSGSSRLLYALTLDGRIPVRARAMQALQTATSDAVVRPLHWGTVDWPRGNQRRFAVICTHPSGPRLVANDRETFEPVPASRLISNYALPLAGAVRAVADARVAHRAIRLTNLYRRSSDRSLVLGECFSGPPGSHQPVVYEPLERAMAHPLGRGEGAATDDLYAMGVLLLALFLGRTPLAEYADRQIIDAKIAKGSFAVLTSGQWMPQELAEAIRGLLRDDPGERWDIAQLEGWLSGRRRNPVLHQKEFRAERPFRFGGVLHYSARSLSVALNDSWMAGIDIARSGKLREWATRSLKDQQCSEALAEVGLSKGGPRQISDDLLLARTLAALDPRGPIRYNGFAVMPDGFGPAFALAIEDQHVARSIAGIFQGMLPGYWARLQEDRENPILAAQEHTVNVGRYLSQAAPGFHLERCAYELNPLYPCRSSSVAEALAIDLASLMAALDAAGAKSAAGDRHVLAFLASQLKSGVDKQLANMAQAASPADQALGLLRLLAHAQEKSGLGKLERLTKAFVPQLRPVVLAYYNRPLRERMHRALEQAATEGSLAALLAVVDQAKQRQIDAQGYRVARTRYRALRVGLQLLRQAEKRREFDSLKLGHKLAAYASGLISVGTIAVLLTRGIG